MLITPKTPPIQFPMLLPLNFLSLICNLSQVMKHALCQLFFSISQLGFASSIQQLLLQVHLYKPSHLYTLHSNNLISSSFSKTKSHLFLSRTLKRSNKNVFLFS